MQDLEADIIALREEADELNARADRMERELESMEDYLPWVEEIRDHKDIPAFQKMLIEEKLDNGTIRGSDLRQAYQSGGMMPPTDLIGLP